ncbi:hypothetical protein [Paenibacillus arenosi]|uniref:Lipoprotein n=1 Tax=Paenibacillus arenosi TaxID=2774142 RepID=A0ABR9AWL3_9BACL|nr:hypothetical protein [Paenibacillus arenosi]MBD8497346.1 hypothetical protein [Paenibacillus arenosi]
MKNILFLFLIMITPVIAACSNETYTSASSDRVEVLFTTGNHSIPFATNSNSIKSAEKAIPTELFQSLIQDTSKTIPYIKLGEKIQIDLKNNAPRSSELKEYLLRNDGTLKYKEETAKTIDLAFQDGNGSFMLEENIASFLSSNTQDYEEGATLRGFHFVGEWDNRKEEFVFVVKTDATKKSS